MTKCNLSNFLQHFLPIFQQARREADKRHHQYMNTSFQFPWLPHYPCVILHLLITNDWAIFSRFFNMQDEGVAKFTFKMWMQISSPPLYIRYYILNLFITNCRTTFPRFPVPLVPHYPFATLNLFRTNDKTISSDLTTGKKRRCQKAASQYKYIFHGPGIPHYPFVILLNLFITNGGAIFPDFSSSTRKG